MQKRNQTPVQVPRHGLPRTRQWAMRRQERRLERSLAHAHLALLDWWATVDREDSGRLPAERLRARELYRSGDHALESMRIDLHRQIEGGQSA